VPGDTEARFRKSDVLFIDHQDKIHIHVGVGVGVGVVKSGFTVYSFKLMTWL